MHALKNLRIVKRHLHIDSSGTHQFQVFSGIQPTGAPHLGNYFGAIKQWVDLARINEINRAQQAKPKKPIFCVVDLHSLTAPPPLLPPTYNQRDFDDDEDNVNDKSYKMLASILACGLNHESCVIFRQSHVYEHTQLAWILSCQTPIGRLSQITTFKEKSRRFNKSTGVPVGLFTYPILQAADILLYKTDRVPVGADQAQNIELVRDLARKFNNLYSTDVFHEPQAIMPTAPLSLKNQKNTINDISMQAFGSRVKSLRDPTKKMSKSDVDRRSRLEIVDEPDTIVDNCRKALTDSISSITYDPQNRPGVSNLIEIYSLVSGENCDEIVHRFKGKETSQFKLELAQLLIEYFASVRRKYHEYLKDRAHLDRVLKFGAEQAREIATETLDQVNKLIGIKM